MNEYVSNHVCVACATGFENEFGDDASGSDTTCDLCAENYYVSGNTCVACTVGT